VFALAVDAGQRVVAAFVVEVEAVPAVAGLAEQAQTGNWDYSGTNRVLWG